MRLYVRFALYFSLDENHFSQLIVNKKSVKWQGGVWFRLKWIFIKLLNNKIKNTIYFFTIWRVTLLTMTTTTIIHFYSCDYNKQTKWANIYNKRIYKVRTQWMEERKKEAVLFSRWSYDSNNFNTKMRDKVHEPCKMTLAINKQLVHWKCN